MQGRPMYLIVSYIINAAPGCDYATAHELSTLQMAVDLVLDPDQIDTTVNDIGGLDNILERLVMHC